MNISKWLAAGVVAWVAVSAQAQPAAPIPLSEYWQRVQSTLSTIQALKPGDTVATRASLTQEAASWQAVTAVQLDDGTVVPIDTSALVAELRADPPDLDALHTQLQALLDARAHWQLPRTGSPGPDPAQALSQVLADPVFQRVPQADPLAPVRQWFSNLVQKFVDWLASLLPSEITGNVFILRWLIIAVGVLVLGGVLWFAIRRIASGLVDEDNLDMLDAEGEEIVTSDSALKHAQETSRSGDYRSAVRWLYLSALLTLEERGLLHYDRTRTNREYLRSVGSAPELAQHLRDIIDVFDRVWYGFQPIDAETYDLYTRRVAELRRIR